MTAVSRKRSLEVHADPWERCVCFRVCMSACMRVCWCGFLILIAFLGGGAGDSNRFCIVQRLTNQMFNLEFWPHDRQKVFFYEGPLKKAEASACCSKMCTDRLSVCESLPVLQKLTINWSESTQAEHPRSGPSHPEKS